MKRLVPAGVCLTMLAGAAGAADLRTAPPPPAPVPVFSWSGFYIGAHAGYLWSHGYSKITDVSGPILSSDVSNGIFPRSTGIRDGAAMAGLQAGYNFQSGMFVGGFEADISWAHARGRTSFSAVDPGPYFPGARTDSVFQSDLDWLGTVRARAGIAMDRMLVYATGGLAYGEVRHSFSTAIPPAASLPSGYSHAPWTRSDVDVGWAAGAGVEYALTNNVSVKVEYVHYDLGSHTIRASDEPVFGPQYLDFTFSTRGEIVRGGLNMKF